MNKFFQIFLYIFLVFFSVTSTFANQKVEDIFIDIDKNFEYKSELQYLFDNWLIQSNNFKNFSPNQSISREEFLWLLLETNCQKCVKPNTNIDILSTYYWKNVYYDVNKNSDYFYCIAYADDKKYIQWYEKNTVCNNWTSSSQAPFCPYNPITNQEALAIIMRTSWLLTQQSADNIIQEIYEWKDFPDLSNDMSPKFTNGEINNFYPYYYIAQNISHTDVDIYGNIQEYFLLNKKWKNYFPQASLSKEQMLRFAYFSYKNSQCSAPNNQIWWKIQIKNGSCKPEENCNIPADYSVNSQIDFEWIFDNWEVIEMPDENYTWVIHNLENNSETIYNGRYLDNIAFDVSWDYKADLYVTDALWNTGKFTQNFTISQKNNNFLEGYISYNQNENTSQVNFSSKIKWNNGPFTYYWDFGDGNTSNQQNPNHIYTQPGNYNVELIVTDDQWNKKNFYTQTQINNSDNSNWGFPWVDLIIIWENNVADFNADNITADNYYWDFGDGNTSSQQNPNHSYSQPGDYDVTLVVDTPNGTQEFDLQIQIPQSEDDFFAIISIQKNNSEENSYNFSPKINGGKWPFKYLWDFGDGNTSTQKTPTHNYNSTGNKTVTLIVTDSQDNQSQGYTTIIVNPQENNIKMLVEDTQDIYTKEFTAVQTNKTPNTTYQWDFGDGNSSTKQNPSHKYDQPGKYEVILKITDVNGVKEIVMIVIIEDGNSNLDANAQIISKNILTNNYQFEAEIIAWEWPFEYLWDFWDANTSNQQNPNHTFIWPWPHQITLLITDKDGNQIVKNFLIYPEYEELNIWLNISPQDNNNNYDFQAEIIAWEWPFEYLWDFWDGNTSNQQNPNHTFEFNGEYSVELIVIDNFWNQKKQFTTIVVSSQQDNSFNVNLSATPSSWNAPLITDFSSSIIWNQQDNYTFLWDFWDGSSAIGKERSHTYYSNGSYIVTLTAKNSSGKEIKKTITITVLDGDISTNQWENIPQSDSDNDGVSDENDRCIDLPGDRKNQWCPIFDISCEFDSDCPNSSKCASNILGNKTCIAVEKQVTCNDSAQWTIQWNVVCTTCPCQNTLNFKAQLRSCDIVFPAIVSPDGKDIYSKWKYFQIK